MKEISNIDRLMQCRLSTFRAEFKKFYEAVKEIERDYGLKPGENILDKE